MQIGLILIGIILIIAVFLFNWWQDRRLLKKMQEHFPEQEADPLMTGSGAVRREPGIQSLVLDEPLSPGEDDSEEVDSAIEAVIDISFADPVESVQLADALSSIPDCSSKPVRMFAESSDGGHRSRLRAGESYSSLQLAVLLANRSGPLTDIDWSTLWSFAQEIANRFDGELEGPEYQDVVQKAQVLDEFCASLDAQVGVVLQLPQSSSTESVTGVLVNSGFSRKSSHLAYANEEGVSYFTAWFNGKPIQEFNSSQVERLDLVLDLPNSPADNQAFTRMAGLARDLAHRLDAQVLDDQGRPLPEHTDSAIDEQLYTIYQRLEEAGFTAGGSRAARIFS